MHSTETIYDRVRFLKGLPSILAYLATFFGVLIYFIVLSTPSVAQENTLVTPIVLTSPSIATKRVSAFDQVPQAQISNSHTTSLDLSLHVSPRVYIPAGGVLRYTIRYTNTGEITVNQVVVTSTVPQHTHWINIQDNGVEYGNVITWIIPTIPVGHSGTVNFRVQVNEDVDKLTLIMNKAYLAYQTLTGQSNTTVNEVKVMPDFGLTLKSVSYSGSYRPSEAITYTICYTNSGTLKAEYVVITDAVPNYIHYVSGGLYIDGVVKFTISEVDEDESDCVSFSGIIENDVPAYASIVNTATISTLNEDNTEPLITDPVVFTVTAPELQLTQSVNYQHPIQLGDLLTYTLTYMNRGDVAATDVTITDTLLPNLVYEYSSNANLIHDQQRLTWTIETIPVSATDSVTFTAWITGGTATVENCVYLNSRERSVLSSCHAITLNIPVLTIHKSAVPVYNVKPGKLMTYTLAYTNYGNALATGVKIRDILPPDVQLVSSEDYNTATHSLNIPIGPVAVGATGVVSFTVRAPITLEKIITNAAFIFNDQIYPATYVNHLSQGALNCSFCFYEVPPKIGGNQGIEYIAQSFTATAPLLSRIGISVCITQQAPPPLSIELWQNDSERNRPDPSHRLISHELFDMPLCSYQFIKLRYPISLTVAQRYWLVINGADPTADGYATTRYTHSFPKHIGPWAYSNSGGTNWIPGTDGTDLDVYIEFMPPPTSNLISHTVMTPNLQLYQSVAYVSPIRPGTILTYTLTYTNSGDVSADEVVITDTLSQGLIYPAHNDDNFDEDTHTIHWSFDTIPANATNSVTFTAQITVTDGITIIYNQAHLSAAGELPVLSNIVTTPIEIPVMKISKIVTPVGNVSRNAILTYTLAYTNVGTIPATGVTLLDQLSGGIEHIAGGYYISSSRVVSFAIVEGIPVGVGDIVSFTVQVNAGSGTKIVNSAEVMDDVYMRYAPPPRSNSVNSLVINYPPYIEAPSPDKEDDLLLNHVVLRWHGGDNDGDDVTYTLAFGDENPPPIITSTQATVYTCPTTLELGRRYYWQITATDGISSVISPIYLFTTTTGVKISGPHKGAIYFTYRFSATVTISVTQPVTYVWNTIGVVGSTPITHPEKWDLDDAISLTWLTTGTHSLVVTAIDKNREIFSKSHEIVIGEYVTLYLPIILRRWPPIPESPTLLGPIGHPGGNHPFTITWTANGSIVATYYNLKETLAPECKNVITTHTQTNMYHVVDGAAKLNRFYCYYVEACSKYGCSKPSNMEQVDVRLEYDLIEYGPNDDIEQFNGPIEYLGQSYYGYHNDLKDYYQIDLGIGKNIHIELASPFVDGVQLQIRDQNDERLKYISQSPYELDFGGSGKYYIVVGTDPKYYSLNALYYFKVTEFMHLNVDIKLRKMCNFPYMTADVGCYHAKNLP